MKKLRVVFLVALGLVFQLAMQGQQVDPSEDVRFPYKDFEISEGLRRVITTLEVVQAGANISVFKAVEFGYLNDKDSLVFTITASNAGRFSDGLAFVEVKGKCGYIDTKGEWVIKPKFAFAGDFNNGVAVIGENGVATWVINKKGEKINELAKPRAIKENGFAIRGQQYGRSRYVSVTKTVGFKTRKGNVEVEDRQLVSSIGQDYIVVNDRCFDLKGNLKFNIEGEVVSVQEDMIMYRVKIAETYKYGFVNSQGEVIARAKYDVAYPFNKGKAVVGYNKYNKWPRFVIDTTGKVIKEY